MKISAIMLAAGFSHRMGRDKLKLALNGETLLQHACKLLEGLPVYEKILVATAERLEGLELSSGTVSVINPNPERGQSESLKLGVSAARGEAYLFLAADQPHLTPQALQFLLDAANSHPEKTIFPTIRGSPAMPAVFPRRFRAELLSLTGDAGGRALREKHPSECFFIEAPTPEAFTDIDFEEDYQKLVSADTYPQ